MKLLNLGVFALLLAAGPLTSVPRGDLVRPYSHGILQYFCGACGNCATYPSYFKHDFTAWGPLYPVQAGGWHSCLALPCVHGPCIAAQRPDSATLVGGIRRSDVAERFEIVSKAFVAGAPDGARQARSLLADFPDRVILNVPRHALQLVGECGPGLVAAHLTLSAEIVRSLAAAGAPTLIGSALQGF